MGRICKHSLSQLIILLFIVTQGLTIETINYDIIQSQVIQEPSTGECQISTSKPVIFRSDTEIILKSGFSAPNGSDFRAYITNDNDVINGYIRYNGSPVSGIWVTLTGTDRLGRTVNLQVQTDANGYYRFSDLTQSNAAGYTLTPISSSSDYTFESRTFLLSEVSKTLTQSYDADKQPKQYIAGYVPGSYSVDQNGAANYIVPINTPPGINGIEPKLSIAYNSMQGDGLLGVGFSLGGLSAITRGPTNLVRSSTIHGVNLDSGDRFRLNGQDLICISLTSGADGAEYRTEIESFSKIVSNGVTNGSPQSFTVWTKDGLIMKFGATANSRILTQNGKTLLWALESIEDRAGNALKYTYSQTGSDFCPVRIEYAYIGSSPKCKVEFEYSDYRPIADTSYIKGNLRQVSRRLTDIKIYAANQLVSDYYLQYEKSSNGEYITPLRLKSVSLCDAQMGCLEPTSFARLSGRAEDSFCKIDAGACPNLTDPSHAKTGDFNGDGMSDLLYERYGSFYVWLSNSSFYSQPGSSQGQYLWGSGHVDGATYKTGDFNGDGRDDVAEISGNQFYVWKTNSQGTDFDADKTLWVNLNSDHGADDSDAGFEVGDFNGDGKMDFIHHVMHGQANAPTQVRDVLGRCIVDKTIPQGSYIESNSSHIIMHANGTYTSLGLSNRDCDNDQLGVIDCEGNPDGCARFDAPCFDRWAWECTYTQVTPPSPTYKSFIWLSKKAEDGFERMIDTGWRNDLNALKLGDFNGDGMTDLLEASGNTAYVSISNGVSGFSVLKEQWSGGLDFATIKAIQTADFNGDGKTDVVSKNSSGQLKVLISNGIAFTAPCVWGSGFQDEDLNYIGDFNGDGKADILASQASINGTDQTGIIAYISNGLNALTPSKWNVHWQVTNVFPTNPILSDISGDGSTDLICIGSTFQNLITQPNLKKFDLVNSITDGLGKNISSLYYILSVGGGTKENDAQYPIRDFLGPMTVVKSYQISNGINGAVNEYRYTYQGPKIDIHRKSFLGFHKIKISTTRSDGNPYTDVNTETTYLQKYPFTGMVDRVDVTYDHDSGDTTVADNMYKSISNEARVTTLTQNGTSDSSRTDFNLSSIPADMRFFPYLSGIDEKEYYTSSSSGGSPVRETTTTNSYLDGNSSFHYGTLCNQSIVHKVYGGSQYTETMVNSDFTDNESSWIVGKPGKTVAGSGDEDGNSYEEDGVTTKSSMSLVTKYEYYGTGDQNGYPGQLKKTSIEPDSDDIKLRHSTTYLYQTESNSSNANSCPSTVKGMIMSVTESGYNGYNNENNQPYTGERSTSYCYDYSAPGTFTVTKTMPEGVGESFVYDWKSGSPLFHFDPNNQQTSWQYDSFGRRLNEIRPDHTTTTCSFDKGTGGHPNSIFNYHTVAYHIHSSETGEAEVITYYDMLDRPVGSATKGMDGTTEKNIYTRTGFDSWGRVEVKSLPFFSSSTSFIDGETGVKTIGYKYDFFNNVTEVNAFDTGLTAFQYNMLSSGYSGLTNSITNSKGQTTKQTFNAKGLISRVTDAAGSVTLYGYDPFGKLDYVNNSAGNVTKMSYDVRGRKVSMKDPDMGSWEYTYNAFNDLVKQKDANSTETHLRYDNLSRILSSGTDSNPANATYSWQYDMSDDVIAMGKLVCVSGTNGFNESYTYDRYFRPKGMKITVNESDGTPHTYETTTEYDEAGRVKTVTYPSVAMNNSNERLSIGYQYDSYGFLSRVYKDTMTFWLSKGRNALGQLTKAGLGNGLDTDYGYETTSGRLNNIRTYTAGGINRQNLSYAYDNLGNLLSRQNTLINKTENFSEYDNLNRLKKVKLGDIEKESYTYDAIGNISQNETYQYGTRTVAGITYHGGPHALTSADGVLYNYDANGNMLSGDGRTITYDHFNRPEKVQKTDSLYVDFYYDDADQVVRQYIKYGNTTTETVFIGSLFEKVKTRVESESTTEEKTEFRHYIMADGEAVAIYTKKPDEPDEANRTQIRYLHKDHLGSTDVISKEDGTADADEKISFTAFGKSRGSDWTSAQDMSTAITQHGFTGHLQLGLFGLIHMQGRMYDPKIGRFVSPDPMMQDVYDPQNLNRYSYCLNNPLRYTDPTGYQPYVHIDIGGWNPEEEARRIQQNLNNWIYDTLPKGNVGIVTYGSIPYPSGIGFNNSTGRAAAPAPSLSITQIRGSGSSNASTSNASSKSYESGTRVLNRLQGGLEVVGILDPTGVADLTNAGIYAIRGQWTDAGISVIGVIPYVGDLAKGVKYTSRSTIVIGRVKDLQKLKQGERSLLDRLPYLGSPKANWKQNSGVLRHEMAKGQPIRDASPGDTAGKFLNAERNLLKNHGWSFDPQSYYWIPPK